MKNEKYKKEFLFIVSFSPIIEFVILLFTNCNKNYFIIIIFIFFIFLGILFFISSLKYFKEKEEEDILKDNHIKKLYETSIKDPLTGLYNRLFLSEKLKDIELLIKKEIPVSIMMLDIDNFKKINDNKGHFYGDYILKKISNLIKDNIRINDFLCRYGGEEFIIIFPYTIKKDCYIISESIRNLIETNVGVTVSIGISQIKNKNDIEKALIRADKALYCAKNKGKNCVIDEDNI